MPEDLVDCRTRREGGDHSLLAGFFCWFPLLQTEERVKRAGSQRMARSNTATFSLLVAMMYTCVALSPCAAEVGAAPPATVLDDGLSLTDGPVHARSDEPADAMDMWDAVNQESGAAADGNYDDNYEGGAYVELDGEGVGSISGRRAGCLMTTDSFTLKPGSGDSGQGG